VPKCTDCEDKDDEFLKCLENLEDEDCGPPPDCSRGTAGDENLCLLRDNLNWEGCMERKGRAQEECDDKGEEADDCWLECHEEGNPPGSEN